MQGCRGKDERCARTGLALGGLGKGGSFLLSPALPPLGGDNRGGLGLGHCRGCAKASGTRMYRFPALSVSHCQVNRLSVSDARPGSLQRGQQEKESINSIRCLLLYSFEKEKIPDSSAF